MKPALTFGHKKSAGIHHTLLRSATTYISYGEAYAISASLFGDILPVHFPRSQFE